MTERWSNWLRSAARDFHVEINEEALRLLDRFVEELLNANQATNLTAITDPEEIAESLILDSLVPGKYLFEKKQILDLGTGGGFPGIPLKIVFPELHLTLIDAKRKKINFLKYVIRQLRLENIEARQIRAEDIATQGRNFDAVITRAVADLAHLIQLVSPLLEEEGVLIAMKGSHYQAEIDALRQHSFLAIGREKYPIEEFQIDVETYRLPISGIERALIFVRF